MSTNKLLARLQAQFPIANLAGSFTGVGGTMTLDAEAPPVDTSGFGAVQAPLANLDLGGIAEAAASIGADGQALLAGLPGAGDLFAPVSAILGTVEGLAAGGGPSALLTRLNTEVTAASVGRRSGLAGVEQALAPFSGVAEDGVVGNVIRLGSALLPGLDAAGPLGQLGRYAQAGKALITMIGALMVVHGRAEHSARLAQRIDALLPPGKVENAAARLAAWADSTLASEITPAVANDPAAVERIGARVGEYAAAIVDLRGTLEAGLGLGEAALVHGDLPGALRALAHASQIVLTTDCAPIQAVALEVATWAEGVLAPGFGPDAPSLDSVVSEATGFIGQLVTALESLDVGVVGRPVADSIGRVTGLIGELNRTLDSVVGTVRTTLSSVRDAVSAIDLRRITEAVQTAIRPIADAIAELDRLLSASLGAIASAVGTITGAITTLKTNILAAAGSIAAAFDQLGVEVAKIDLSAVVGTLRAGIQGVADELNKLQLDPYFDTAIDIMDTGADALELVPFDILPDDAKAKVDEVAAKIRSIDFAQVRQVLTQQLQTILDELDTDVLATIQGYYDQLVGFLRGIDPRTHIATLEAETFDPLIEQLRALDPDALLRPVTEVITAVQARLAAIDLRGVILKPVEDAFTAILERFDEFNPAELIAPLQERLEEVRTQVLAVTGLTTWADRLDELQAGVTGALDRLDLAQALPDLESAYNAMLAALRGAPGGSAVGALIAALLQNAMPVRPASFAVIADWIGGGNPVPAIAGLITPAGETLRAVRARAETLDPAGAGAAAMAFHRRLATAVAALPVGSALRLRLEAAVAVAPLDQLAAGIAGKPRYLAALDAAIAALVPAEHSGFSELTAGSGNLRSALAPIDQLKHRAMALCRRFGVDPAGRDLASTFAGILAVLRPARVLAAIQPLVDVFKAKVTALVVTGLVAPLKVGVAELRALIDHLDLAPVRDELAALHAQVRDQIQGLRPSVMLGDVLDAFDAIKANLASYDPLESVRVVIASFKAAVEDLAGPDSVVRPHVMFAGAIDAYERILDFAGDLAIRDLLQPVLGALDGIVEQLDSGLGRAEGSFARLQGALPEAG